MGWFPAEREWALREEFPDLTKAKRIAIDLETKDPDLKKEGSGALKGKGNIVGVAIAVDDFECYYPFAHEHPESSNHDKNKILTYIQSICNSESHKIFHNAMYDVTWLRKEGINIKGPIFDTMIAASLIDENRFSYALGALGPFYCQDYKSEKLLKDFAKEKGWDAKKDLWRIPSSHVGHYAEQDAALTLNLWKKLREKLIAEKLLTVFNLETKLFPCIVDMKFKGVRVNMERAHQLKTELKEEEEKKRSKIKEICGLDVEIYAARSIQKALDKVGITDYGKTATDLPSFTKNYLKNHQHELPRLIAETRECNKAHTTFIDTIIKHEHKGRIHADINQIRSDEGGTVTGRFSYQNPNLQQIPARNKDLGPKIRSIFIPEEKCTWGCFDYSQQEPRLLVHYASVNFGPKSKTKSLSTVYKTELYSTVKDIIQDYQEGKADFHQMVADMAEISRIQAKTINLGLMYGMGKGKLQGELGVEAEDAKKIFNKYHDSVGFVKALSKKYSEDAECDGVIETLLGRKCHFDRFQPRGWRKHPEIPLEAEKAMEKWEDKDEMKDITPEEYKQLKHYDRKTQRAFTYRALNRLIQGSAADQTKISMVMLHKEGIVPHIQIHDELNISIESKDMADKITQIMETSVNLDIPNKVDYDRGSTWGEINKFSSRENRDGSGRLKPSR